MLVSRVPLRISLIGGGTDFREFFQIHGGAVLSLAINKYMYVCVNPSFTERVRVSYSDVTEIVPQAVMLKHDIVRECLMSEGIKNGIEVVTVGDVPGHGTGLGSSSALAVGLLLSLDCYKRQSTSHTSIAQSANRIEIDKLKRPIGEQDAFGCAFPGVKQITWSGAETNLAVSVGQQNEDMASHLSLFWCGGRDKESQILSEHRKNIGRNLSDLEMIRDLALESHQMLRANDYEGIGKLMAKAWVLKRGLVEGISTTRIDKHIESAIDQGAWAGKVCGAGGGGFMVIMGPPNKHYELDCKPVPFKVDTEGAQCDSLCLS